MDADHHTICKFKDRTNPNFVKLRGVLRSWASQLSRWSPRLPASVVHAQPPGLQSQSDVMKTVRTILGVDPGLHQDVLSLKHRVTPGSGKWLLSKQDFVSWIDCRGSPHFWLAGLPGSGKSVLTSRVVEHLQDQDFSVQHHFFERGDQTRQTGVSALRAIAAQLARCNPEFRDALLDLYKYTGFAIASPDQNFIQMWEKVFEGIIFQITLTQPLYWVFDAVDECDSPASFLSSLSKIRSQTPIKIFLSSRPLKNMSSFDSASISTHFIQDSDTIDDIRAYVAMAVCNTVPDGHPMQSLVLEHMLSLSSGSFLWVKFAVESLQDNWHTREALESALTRVPKGMMSMYRCLAENLVKQSTYKSSLATAILAWVACSWRTMTVAELDVALEPEFGKFTSLELTIDQVCGNFTRIDRSDPDRPRVSMIHETARQFLLFGDTGSGPFLDLKKCHEDIAVSCLSYLCNEKWKGLYAYLDGESLGAQGRESGSSNRLATVEQGHPFLRYSMRYWAFHVSRARCDSLRLSQALKSFFMTASLSWIQGLGLSGDIQYLIRSAQSLRSYARARAHQGDAPLSQATAALGGPEWILPWATDFLRIAGKFGRSIVQRPSSIHRLVPSLCPSESMLARTFKSSRPGAFTVTGLSTVTWDDCLSSVFCGNGDVATQVLATDSHFITRLGSAGKLEVWNAETCQQVRVLCQGEYVMMMVLNNAGTLVATSGYKTFGIWDISSGKRVREIIKPDVGVVLDMRFGSRDQELVVAMDSTAILYFNLKLGTVSRAFIPPKPPRELRYMGCPGRARLNRDVTKVAMGWRGATPLAWDLTTPQPMPPLRCRTKAFTDSINDPEQIHWQPKTSALLVLCMNTSLVEWRLHDDEQIEHKHIKARDIMPSPDGKFLLSHVTAGIYTVWMFPRLHPIYTLSTSGNTCFTSMAFSLTGQRFYDLRGDMCHVWEPDVLTSADEDESDEQTEKGGEGKSAVTTDVVVSSSVAAWAKPGAEITAFATSTDDRYVVCGREDGNVIIYEATEGAKIRKVYGHVHKRPVSALVWARSGKYIASCDDCSGVVIKRLQKKKEEGKWDVYPVLIAKVDERGSQFTFSEDERYLILSSASRYCVWDVLERKEVGRREWDEGLSGGWLQHPNEPGALLRLGIAGIKVLNWDNFLATLANSAITAQIPAQASVAGLPALASTSPKPRRQQSKPPCVQWAAATTDQRFIISSINPDGTMLGRHTCMSQIQIVVTSLHSVYFPTPISFSPSSEIMQSMSLLLGMHWNSLVFVDHDCWVCSWDIGAAAAEVQQAGRRAVSTTPQANEKPQEQTSLFESVTRSQLSPRRHFFIPMDWMNNTTSHLAKVNDHGTFFCPKQEEVAIVREGLNHQSWT